jgi:nitrous oxidase accessory protein NosD
MGHMLRPCLGVYDDVVCNGVPITEREGDIIIERTQYLTGSNRYVVRTQENVKTLAISGGTSIVGGVRVIRDDPW